MALSGPCNIHQVKRGSELTISGCSLGTGFDHFRLLVYRLDASGGRTLILTTDAFGYCPIDLLFGDANDPSGFVLNTVDDTFYQIEVREYDAGETVSDLEDEHFVHCFPDDLDTQGDEVSVSSALFSRLLWMLGHNVLDGEFLQPSGYTQSSVRRGYGSLTEDQADEVLEDSDSPEDTRVQFKSKILITTMDNGNKTFTLETEQTVT